MYNALNTILPFSAFRCFVSNDAINPQKYHGYFSSTLQLIEVTMTMEKPPTYELLIAALNSGRSPNILPLWQHAWKNLINQLIPKLYLLITVDNRIVYKSDLFSVHEKIIDTLLQETETLYHESNHHHIEHKPNGSSSYIIKKQCFSTNTSTYDKDHHHHHYQSSSSSSSCWIGNFDLYHPKSALGFHLMAYDSTCNEALDEILESHFIMSHNFLKLKDFSSIALHFKFELPYSSISTTEITPASRQCEVQLVFKMTGTFNSFFKSIAPLACDYSLLYNENNTKEDLQKWFQQHLAINQPIRIFTPLIETTTTEDDGDNNGIKNLSIQSQTIETTLKTTQMCLDIILFWIGLLHSKLNSILTWKNPYLTFLSLIAILGIIFNIYRYGILCLIISVILISTRFMNDPIQHKIALLGKYETPENEWNLNATFKDTTQTFSKRTNNNKDDDVIAPQPRSATDRLLHSLVESALPVEIYNFQQWLLQAFIYILPNLIFIHSLLTWHHSPCYQYESTCCLLLNKQTQQHHHYKENEYGFSSNPYFNHVLLEHTYKKWWRKIFHVNTTTIFILSFIVAIFSITCPNTISSFISITILIFFTILLFEESPIGKIFFRIVRACIEWLTYS